MLFSSLTFLFAFLPMVLALYYLSNEKYRNYILLAASLIFYAWGEPKYIILMILSIVFNYVLVLLMNKSKKRKKVYLVFAVMVNIGALFVFKYLDFAITNANLAFGLNMELPGIRLPIGISFYTFQILSYVIDVYRKNVSVQKNIFILGTYIALFPQLIAGPIVRYSSIDKQLKRRTCTLKKFCGGFRRFIIGFCKKVLIANNVAVIADAVFNQPTDLNLNMWIVFLALLAYTLQIYYDFSGYSDMAIGLGKMFGFEFEENFNYPYSAKSITDFWKRWHISLTTWFRDYLYIPLGGNRCSKAKWIRNFFVVWLLTGLWHGANWNFILWGLFYAIILLFEKRFLKTILEKIPRVLAWAYTFLIVNIGWLLFRVNNLNDLKYILSSIVSSKVTLAQFLGENFSIVSYLFFVLVGIVFMFPFVRNIVRRLSSNDFVAYVIDLILVLLFILGIFALISSSYNPFIYFRF